MRALQQQPVRARLSLGGQAARLDRRVDGLLGHAAVRRPLPAGDGDEVARRGVDHVVANLGWYEMVFQGFSSIS